MIKISFFLPLIFAFILSAFAFIRGETLKAKDVENRWGKEKFSAEVFKQASIQQRSKMAADLLKNQKQFFGKDAVEVRKSLGDFSGHYFSESYPTYLIEKGSEIHPESWQLVFLIDRNSKVKEIVVHKNCCY